MLSNATKGIHLFIQFLLTGPRLAQLVRAPDCIVREVEGSCPGRSNTHGLKITEENLLPFYNIKKWIDVLVFSDKDK